jgi:hypothetical protein
VSWLIVGVVLSAPCLIGLMLSGYFDRDEEGEQ